MFIKRIVIENVRGFRSLDFNLERSGEDCSGWTVITGDNASGKTAFLKAVSLAIVGPETARILQPSVAGWIHKAADVGRIAVHIIAGEGDRFAQRRRYDKPFWAELLLKNTNDGRATLEIGWKYIRKGKRPTRGPWLDAPDGWFCTGYGPFRRLYGHSPEAHRIMSTPGKASRFATMFREDATLGEGDLWLRELRYRELEGAVEARDALRKVLAVLNSNFFQHGMRVERVDSEGLWLRQSDGIVLSLRDMSDGYRAAVAMIVDIVRKLIDVYGLRGFASTDGGEARVEYDGVVMVDEIDAHLHPSWQRLIGEWFKRIMPNIQFIVTSHSPLICQAADEKGIFRLPAPGSGEAPVQLSDNDYEKIVAGRPNEIFLGPAFEMKYTRSPRAVRARTQYANLQARKSARALTRAEAVHEKQISLYITDEEDHAPD